MARGSGAGAAKPRGGWQEYVILAMERLCRSKRAHLGIARKGGSPR